MRLSFIRKENAKHVEVLLAAERAVSERIEQLRQELGNVSAPDVRIDGDVIDLGETSRRRLEITAELEALRASENELRQQRRSGIPKEYEALALAVDSEVADRRKDMERHRQKVAEVLGKLAKLEDVAAVSHASAEPENEHGFSVFSKPTLADRMAQEISSLEAKAQAFREPRTIDGGRY